MKDSVKRVGLYFNLENPIEKEMWDYICNGRKKSDVIKRLIEEKINNNCKEEIKRDIKKEGKISKEDITNCDGINF